MLKITWLRSSILECRVIYHSQRAGRVRVWWKCLPRFHSQPSSNFVLLQTIFPDRGVWRDAVLAVIDQDVHRAHVHRLANVEIIVVVVCKNLLDRTWRTSLKGLCLLIFALFLQLLKHFFAVCCR